MGRTWGGVDRRVESLASRSRLPLERDAVPMMGQPRRGRVEEAALVRAARNGDREAFMQLVRVHQAGVRAFAHGLLGDRVLAEDIAQEAFLRAWRGLEKFRGEAAFATWLYAIARRVALDEVRRPALRTVPVEQ